MKIGDDIGTDFICTTFKKEPCKDKNGAKYEDLIPKSSFFLQIKKNNGETLQPIEFGSFIEYFFELQLPYFLGIVNLDKNSLTLYSGEALNHFFSKYGYIKSNSTKFKSTDIKINLVENIGTDKDGKSKIL